MKVKKKIEPFSFHGWDILFSLMILLLVFLGLVNPSESVLRFGAVFLLGGLTHASVSFRMFRAEWKKAGTAAAVAGVIFLTLGVLLLLEFWGIYI